MLSREMWCKTAEALREYWGWELKMYNLGIDLQSSPAGTFADQVLDTLQNGDEDWAYDARADVNWLVEWTSNSDCEEFLRTPYNSDDLVVRTQSLYFSDAESLLDFILTMRAEGWPVETPRRWLAEV